MNKIHNWYFEQSEYIVAVIAVDFACRLVAIQKYYNDKSRNTWSKQDKEHWEKKEHDSNSRLEYDMLTQACIGTLYV